MIYMEYCEGGSLQDLINERVLHKTPISEQYIWNILFQLASALLYCHLGLQVDDKGRVSSERRDIAQWNPVLHRDIKPANVFLFSRSETALDCVRLGDFGLGYKLQNDTAPETYAGTAQYLAPEISRTSIRSIHWTEHCDIFSLGCTIYALCTFGPPFNYHMENEAEAYEPLSEHYSDQLRACIASCLSFYPQTRPNALRLFQQSQRHIDALRVREPDSTVSVEIAHSIATNVLIPSRSTETPRKRRNRKKSKANPSLSTGEQSKHKSLLGAGANRASPTGEIQDLPNNVLREAVSKGDVDLTQKALEMEGADPNATTSDRSRMPMLSLATNRHHDQVVKVLIDAGADVNKGSGDKSRVLHWAAKHNRCAIIEVLLKKGASVNEVDGFGRTALSYAAEEGHNDAIRLLLGADADINTQGFYERTPLHLAALKGRIFSVRLLLAAGASKLIKDASGLNAEALAKGAGNHAIARLLSIETIGLHGIVAEVLAKEAKNHAIARRLSTENSPLEQQRRTADNQHAFEVPSWMRLEMARKDKARKDKEVKLVDLAKFSQNFQLHTPVPKDLIPILSKDKAKQEEMREAWNRVSHPGGSTLAQHPSQRQKQVRGVWTEGVSGVPVRLPMSSVGLSLISAQRQSRVAVSPKKSTAQALRPAPPIPVTYSQALRRGTIHASDDASGVVDWSSEAMDFG